MKRLLSPFSVLALALLSAGTVPSLRADTAFFTKDTSEVVFTPVYQSGLLWRLNLKSAKPVPIALGGALKGKDVSQIAQGADGEILLTADNGVWVLDKDGQPRKIADEKEPESFFIGPAMEGPLKDWLFTVRGGGGRECGGRAAEYFLRSQAGGQNFPLGVLPAHQ